MTMFSRPWPISLRACLPLLALALPGAGAAQVAGYRLDPVHTRVLFGVDHAGFSTALGTISGSTGMLAFDPDDWRSAKLQVQIPLQHADMGDARWTDAVLGRRLLDSERYPLATFASSRVEPVDATHATVCGTLTLHAIAREQCLQVTLNQLKRDPVPPFRRTAGFSATATLKRSDYGIDAWAGMVGDDVELRIEAEAVRDGDALDALETVRTAETAVPATAPTVGMPAPDAPLPEAPSPDRPQPDVLLPDAPASDVPLPDASSPTPSAPDTPQPEAPTPTEVAP